MNLSKSSLLPGGLLDPSGRSLLLADTSVIILWNSDLDGQLVNISRSRGPKNSFLLPDEYSNSKLAVLKLNRNLPSEIFKALRESIKGTIYQYSSQVKEWGLGRKPCGTFLILTLLFESLFFLSIQFICHMPRQPKDVWARVRKGKEPRTRYAHDDSLLYIVVLRRWSF